MEQRDQNPDQQPVSDHDSPWKEALEHYFPDFLELLFPAIHAEIDWQQAPVFLDKELQQVVRDADVGRRYADKLVKVFSREGNETWVLIHVEVQGEPAPDFAERMYRYFTRLRDRYGVDVVSLAVLADSSPAFHPRGFQLERWGCSNAFHFPTAKLLEYLEPSRWAALEQSSNRFALVVMAQLRAKVTKDADELKGWKFRLVRSMYERGYGRSDILEMFRIIDWMISLPSALEALFREDVYQFEEEHKMPYVTTVERAGIEKGIQLGMQQGEAAILLHLMARKFGADVAEHYRAQIEQANTETLLAWSDRILSADTAEAIFH